MAVLTLEETKQYLRVDSADEDDFISGLIGIGESLCADVARMEISELESHLPMARIAVLYAAAYLYEHREQADHGELVGTLRSLLFMGRVDPVECIGVSQQRNGNALNVKPPAMRVRDDCYTKITFPL